MGIFNRHRHLGAEVLSEYLDGRLDQHHQELVALRLAECQTCREELDSLQITVSALHSLPDLPLPRSFTLGTAPSPDYAGSIGRKPAPLLVRAPSWVYAGAASMAGLALALMLSAEATGLLGPASFSVAEAPIEAPAASEADVDSPIAALETAERADVPADSQPAAPPQTALRAEPAAAPEAAAEMDDSALAAKSQPESAIAAPQAAMAESPGAFESGSDAVAGEEAAFTVSAEDAATPALEESAAAAPEEAVPVAPEDSAQIQSNEASTPEASRTPGVRQYPTPSSPVWWKTLEIVFAILTLAFLGAVFFRWRRNRSQVIG